ncbi:MAG: LPS export ABC transporter permease LptF [Methylococcaceae bacterium]|nr:LPS export ABC transporter permease LptF [Methylococcaceae bacterium]
MNSTAFEPPFSPLRRLLPVLDRMVTLELLRTVIAVLTVLVTIIVSRKFLNILTKAIDGEIAANTLLTLLSLKILGAFIILLPAALFLSILMVFGRMYRDQEMAILASGGVGLGRLYRAVAWFVLPTFVCSIYLALDVLPWAELKVQTLMRNDKKTADLRGLKPGRFNEYSRGDVVLYAESFSEADGNLKNLFVESHNGEQNGVTVAESGYLKETETGSHFLVLNHGVRYQGTPGKADYIISEFEEYAVKIDPDGDPAFDKDKRELVTPSAELWRSGAPRERAELQRRFAVPMGALLLGILAIPLSRVKPRSGVYGNVVAAFLIYMLYENLQRVSQGLLISGKVSLWLAYSGVYLFMVGIIVFFLIRSTGLRWCWQVIRGRA